MLLIPYKADVDLGRWPVMTLFVCVVCVWVFARQAYSEHVYQQALDNYCNHQITRDEQVAFRYLQTEPNQHYCHVLLAIRAAPDRRHAMRELAEAAQPTAFYQRGPIAPRISTESWRAACCVLNAPCPRT